MIKIDKLENKIINEKSFTIILIIISFLITVITIISGARLKGGYDIAVDTISLKKIKAPNDVINRIATEKMQNDAYNSVVPSYVINTSIEENYFKDLDNFFIEIDKIRMDYLNYKNRLNELNKITLDAEIDDYFNTSRLQEKKQLEETIKALLNDNNLNTYLTDKQKLLIFNFNSDEFTSFKKNIIFVSNEIYKQGYKEGEFEKIMPNIKNELNTIFLDSSLENLGYIIISSNIKPNLIFDEETTLKNREQKKADVKPVYIQKDETIVDDGQYITPEIYEILNDLGLIQKDFKDVMFLIFGALCITITVFIFALNYIYFFPIKNLTTIKEKLMFFTIYNACIILIWVFGALLTNIIPHYMLPILIFVMITSILFDINFAVIMSIAFSTLAIFIADLEYNYYIYFILTGIMLSINSKFVTVRIKTISLGFVISTLNAFLLFGISLYNNKTNLQELIISSVFAFLNGFLTIIISIGTLPFWEAVFGAVTVVRLLDLTNPNNELLSRLTIEAPGTYHHSLIVANLAESASISVGANSILARVGGYYHDVGKLKYPQYFAENQMGKNPHDLLDPYESAEIIKTHVTYGIELSDQYNLPLPIKDMIRLHHGNTLIKYFYDKAQKIYGDVKEKDFRYNNNIPNSKEVAIVMLADTAEAAVRSMMPKVESMNEISTFIKKLFDDKLNDNQLQDSMLTIKDLDTIREAFLRVFKGMYHERIAYPDMEKQNEKTEKTINENFNIIDSESTQLVSDKNLKRKTKQKK